MKRPAAHIIEPSAEGPATGPLSTDLVSVDLRCAGLNVRPEFADKLVDGLKDVECRKYPLGSRGTEACTFVIRTQGRQKGASSAVIGLVEFAHSRRYLSLAEFNADRHRHCISPGSEFDWTGPEASQMFAWEVRSHVRFATPIPLDGSIQLPARNMIGWCRPVELRAQVTRLDSMKLDGILPPEGCTHHVEHIGNDAALVNPVPDLEMLEALPNDLLNSTLPLLMTTWQSYRVSAALHPGLQAAVHIMLLRLFAVFGLEWQKHFEDKRKAKSQMPTAATTETFEDAFKSARPPPPRNTEAQPLPCGSGCCNQDDSNRVSGNYMAKKTAAYMNFVPKTRVQFLEESKRCLRRLLWTSAPAKRFKRRASLPTLPG
eukprot:s735_g27.t1